MKAFSMTAMITGDTEYECMAKLEQAVAEAKSFAELEILLEGTVVCDVSTSYFADAAPEYCAEGDTTNDVRI